MYSFYLKYVKSANLKIFFLTLLGVGTSVCGVYMAFASKNVVDSATGVSGESFLLEGLKLLLALVLQLLFQVVLSALHVRTSAGLKKSIQAQFFGELLHKDRLKISGFHSGELVNRLAGDVGVIAEGAAEVIPAFFSLTARIVLSFIALLMLEWPLAVMCLALGPVMLLFAKIYRDKTSHLFLKSRESEGEVRSFLQETIQNITAIKAFSAYDIIKNQLNSRQEKQYKLSVLKNAVGIVANVCFFTAMTAGYYVALGWGAYRLKMGAISFGTMTAMLTLSGEITSPFRSVASLFSQYMSIRASVTRLNELESLPGEEEIALKDVKKAIGSISEIVFNNVDFSYGENFVLNGATCEFKKSTLTAVTGESGIGKSTVLGLLAGIYKPTGGHVYLKDKNGAEIELDASFAKMFAFVPQDILILSGTIKENITFFEENPDEKRVERAVRLSCLENDVLHMEDGLNTVLGENGSRLSCGQRQRIAIARALYSGASVLLLDEATSALSQETEEEVIKNIQKEGYTAIIVTHRESVVNLCENILIIKDGKITKK